MRRLAPALAALAVLLAAAPAAEARTLDLPAALRSVVAEIRGPSGVPVLLPGRVALPVEGRVHAAGTARRGRYAIELAGAPDCRRATACSLGLLSARRGAPLGGRPNVRLARGVRGRVVRGTCGASCSPGTIAFVRRGVRYAIQVELDVPAARQRAALVALADAALRAGPR